ncbi:MAG: LysR family transcriptional regulator [Vicinamibacterales bacterium]
MDSQFLQSFVSVIDDGSIAAAARRLDLTPAAVAQRIRALESDVGSPLLVRSGRTVKPTEAGARILDRARGVLREIRDMKSAAADTLPAGQLRLGGIATAMTGLIPGILAKLVGRHPQIEIYLEPGNSISLYRKVSDGDLDAAVVVEPQFAIPKTCDWQTLREEPLILLAPASLPVDDPHTTLATEPFIRYDRNVRGGRLADAYLRQFGIRPRERFELDALDAIAVLVDRGLGVSLVPDWATPWPTPPSLAKWVLPNRFRTRCIGVLWGRASARIRLVRAFLDVAGAQLR